jgi:hypothetical protein
MYATSQGPNNYNQVLRMQWIYNEDPNMEGKNLNKINSNRPTKCISILISWNFLLMKQLFCLSFFFVQKEEMFSTIVLPRWNLGQLLLSPSTNKYFIRDVYLRFGLKSILDPFT